MSDKDFPDARFGTEELPDWRDQTDEYDLDDPDDEELDKTPEDIVQMLGFDPKEFSDGEGKDGDGRTEGQELRGTPDVEGGGLGIGSNSRRDGMAEGVQETGEDLSGEDDEEWHPFLGLGEDEAPFDESKHPRDADGKFAPYQHSLGIVGQGESNKKLKQDLDSLNFKKAEKSKSGKYQYKNNTGATIVVEPPEGGKFKGKPGSVPWSTNWTLYPHANHDNPIKGKGAKSLSEALGQLSKYGLKEPPKKKSAHEMTKEEWAKHVEEMVAPEPKKEEPKREGKSTFKPYQPKPKEPEKKEEPPKQKAPQASEADLAKAKKTTPFYYPDGVPQMAQNVVNAYNNKYEGKTLTDPEFLNQKVQDYKNVKEQVDKAKEVENKNKPKPEPPPKPKQPEYKELQLELAKGTPKPTAQQKSAIQSYTGSSYDYMNNKLRHGQEKIKPGTNEGHLQEYLMSAELPSDAVLSRKVNGKFSKILKSVVYPGFTFHEKGFMSASTAHHVWSGDLKWNIKVKKGQHGAAIDHLSKNSGENEVLFPAGSLIKVIAIKSPDEWDVELIDQKLDY